jgi:hypothetical protein
MGTSVEVLLNRAIALRGINDVESAIALANESLVIAPTVAAYQIKASCLGDLQRYDEALIAVNEALLICTQAERDPIINERGFQRLLSRDWGGWEDWEARIQRFQISQNVSKAWPGIKEWNGEPNSWVLVNAEKGLGDTILFGRYLPTLLERNCKIQLLASKASAPISQLMKFYSGVVGAYSGNDTIPTMSDYWICLESLPKFVDEIPPPLTFPCVPRWRPNNHGSRRLRVGLCWHGNLDYSAAQSRRPQNLQDWEPVTSLPVDFISLQLGEKGPCSTRLPEDSSLRNTLEVVCSCDLVISTDTSVVHMAASLGCPTWMPLHRLNYWPWIMAGEDRTVWYPSMRIFRQESDWPSVFAKIGSALEEMSIAKRCTQ